MSRGGDLPVMVGSRLQKGLMIMRNAKMGGFDLYIVWLNREFQTGETFELADIKKVDHVIHFCDRESVKETIKGLQTMLKMWGGEKCGGKTEKA